MNSPKEWWKTARDFFAEVVTETKKCSFPSRDEVVGKATDLVAPVLGADAARTLIGRLLTIDGIADVRTLRPMLQRR